MVDFLLAMALDMDAEEDIDGEEIFLLQRLNAPRRNLHLSQSYCRYERFDLEAMEELFSWVQIQQNQDMPTGQYI